MKYKVLFLLTITSLLSFYTNAQRGVRIGYIDTEYILQNVPEYKEAAALLDKKVLEWKSEIEKRLSEIEQRKKELDNESVLLTKELYDERFEDISFDEAEVLEYQQQRFGPSGDLMTQKRQLIEPIQDQIFAAVQDIAENGKYDFVFDKSADVVMLYSAERYDLSERVLNTITRTSRRTQAKNKRERKELEDEAVVPIANEEKDERQQAIEDKKAARESELAARRAEREKAAEERRAKQLELREAKRLEAEERRQKAMDARKSASNPEKSESKKASDTLKKTTEKPKAKSENPKPEAKSETPKPEAKKDSTANKKPLTAAEIKAKDRERRRKELEARKKKILEQRKKAREERLERVRKNDSIAKAKEEEEENN